MRFLFSYKKVYILFIFIYFKKNILPPKRLVKIYMFLQLVKGETRSINMSLVKLARTDVLLTLHPSLNFLRKLA